MISTLKLPINTLHSYDNYHIINNLTLNYFCEFEFIIALVSESFLLGRLSVRKTKPNNFQFTVV